jgi:hypothetical protein
LIKVKPASEQEPYHFQMEWQAISIAPFDRDLDLAVIEINGEAHPLVPSHSRRLGQGNYKCASEALPNALAAVG